MTSVRGKEKKPGEFREDQNWIAGEGRRFPDVSYIPPPPIEVVPALELLVHYLGNHEGRYPALVKLALIHYQFEAIHPFLDGNGRLGRLLITLLIVKWRLLPHALLYLSEFFEHHRDEYYDRLAAVTQSGAWEDWTLFFLRGVAAQARDAVVRATRLQDLEQRWREELGTSGASGRAIRLMSALFEAPIMTIPTAQELLQVSHTAATNIVERLVGYGILEEMPRGYRRLFVSRAILAAIEDPISAGGDAGLAEQSNL